MDTFKRIIVINIIMEDVSCRIAILAAAVDTLVGVSTILAVGIISDFAGVIML